MLFWLAFLRMMNDEKTLIGKVTDLLNEYPGVRYTSRKNYLHIYPLAENGFPISVACLANGRTMVMFHYWFDVFDDKEEVIKMVRFGLSGDCRLRVNKKGSKYLQWTPQYRMTGKWFDMDSRETIYFPVGEAEDGTGYWQNTPLRDEDGGEENLV